MNVKNTYFGFTNNKNPMTKARIEKVLDKVYRFDGVTMSNKEFVFVQLQKGSIPELVENYRTYKRDGELTKPKTDYRLTLDGSFYHIEKTLYDYACHILENGYNNEQTATTFIISEQVKQEQEKQIQLDNEAKEKQERETREREKIEFDQWLNSQAENYNNPEKLELIKEIFLSEIGQFGRGSIRLLVLIENFDNLKCKMKIKEWLSYYNTASIKTFFHVTGINLGKTDKSIQERLNSITSKDFTGMIPYKKRMQHNKVENEMQDTFYIMVPQPEPHFEAVIGEYIKKYNLDMFIREVGKGYNISEARSGIMLVSSDTKINLLDELKQFVDRIGIETINNEIEKLISKNGLSPKYSEAITA